MIKRLFIILFLLLCVPVFAERKLTTFEAIKLAIGPFFDSTDGITPETGIDVTGLTVEIYREFDADTTPTRFANFEPTASGGSNDMVLIGSSVSGMYSLEVTAAQLNFTGAMILTIVDTDSAGIVGLPFWRYFTLTSANVVDTEYGTANLQVLLADTDHTINSLTIDATTGPAVVIIARGGNGYGVSVTGNGSGEGIKVQGGSTGHGIEVTGGGGATGPFDAVKLTAGTAGLGLRATFLDTVITTAQEVWEYVTRLLTTESSRY